MATITKPKKKQLRDAEGKLLPKPQRGTTRTPGVRPDGTAWAVNWIAGGWLVLMHIGALAAPFYFSWEGVALAVFFHWLSGSIGICMGYHRLLTHASFRTYPIIKWTTAAIGALAGEGPATSWVAHHRQHHALSDQEGDPHSPVDGAWWAHMLWLGWTRNTKEHREYLERWAPDLMRDKVLQFVDAMFLPLHFALGITLAVAGYYYGQISGQGVYYATSFVVWGMFLRLVAILHTTWFVNSASHIWGYRNYETTDKSTNLWWVGLLAYGEGWHNNHHAYPRMANHGHKWWEMDMTFSAIRVLKFFGLAWDIVDYKRRNEEA